MGVEGLVASAIATILIQFNECGAEAVMVVVVVVAALLTRVVVVVMVTV